MHKRFGSILWLCAAPLFSQNAQQPSMQMPGMATEKPPTPQLLEGIASRAPLKLEAFLALADKNNPTLQQAAPSSAALKRKPGRRPSTPIPQSAMKGTRFAA